MKGRRSKQGTGKGRKDGRNISRWDKLRKNNETHVEDEDMNWEQLQTLTKPKATGEEEVVEDNGQGADIEDDKDENDNEAERKARPEDMTVKVFLWEFGQNDPKR